MQCHENQEKRVWRSREIANNVIYSCGLGEGELLGTLISAMIELMF